MLGNINHMTLVLSTGSIKFRKIINQPNASACRVLIRTSEMLLLGAYGALQLISMKASGEHWILAIHNTCSDQISGKARKCLSMVE